MKALLELSQISSRLSAFLFYLNCQPSNLPVLLTTMDLTTHAKSTGGREYSQSSYLACDLCNRKWQKICLL